MRKTRTSKKLVNLFNIKSLQFKHEGLNLDPQSHVKSQLPKIPLLGDKGQRIPGAGCSS